MHHPLKSNGQGECSTSIGPEEREPEVVESELTPVQEEEDSFQRNLGNSETPFHQQIEEFTQDERAVDESTDVVNSVIGKSLCQISFE